MQLRDVLDPGNVPLDPVETLGRDGQTLGRDDLEPRALGRERPMRWVMCDPELVDRPA